MQGIRTARAFAPGHVTGIFAPASTGRDPRARGSRGAGVVLELGVVAAVAWRPGAARRLRILDGGREEFPISTDVARRLVGNRRGSLTVRLHHELPIGQGFGMSAAGAAATALAVSAALGRPRVRAIEIAHLGDLFGGGGLGGVAAILGGGLEFRRTPGIPPFGNSLRMPWSPSVFVGVVGHPLPSPPRLRNARFLQRARTSARGLDALLEHPDPVRFFLASERFTDQMGVASVRLRRILRELRADGAWAFQAMFGESFLAAPRSLVARERVIRSLRARGIRAVEVRVPTLGARRLSALPHR
ncbi:pantothenate kinase [mine drainage metagenome]|uniref:Pantothenate kinase n=1 Tax=mine drainage metagenome TaxID=410659 RepID=T0ZSE4_9ZZZZ